MRAKEFIPASKPRNFVVKHQKTAGAGAHRDKKKEQKQGYEKHKGRGVSEGSDNLSIGQQMARDGIKYSPEKEQELIKIMGEYMEKAGMSPKAIRYYLSYDEDFVSDQLEYLPKEGVSEGYGTREFEVDGYTYMTDIDEEEDNRKIWHMLKTPEGKTIDIDFTPYEYMTKDDIELYIKLGMPERQGVGPLDSEKLQKMAQIKGVAMLDPKMARAGM